MAGRATDHEERLVSDSEAESNIWHILLDDGKVNALGTASMAHMHAELDGALDVQAAAVIISGRSGVLSAGFDLEEVRSGESARENLRLQLIDLVLRIFTFERPVVIACTGHALAAGAALLLAADGRIGLDGPFKLGFNEASIGVTISGATVELARYRMPMPYFESIASGETFAPPRAQSAGLLDTVVDDSDQLLEEAHDMAQRLGRVPPQTFVEMRRLTRGTTADKVRNERSKLSTPR
jgi:enoyl-CoA hydratase